MSDATIITLGCRLNAYESEVMRAGAAAAGLGPTVIVNTCAVTAEAVRQAKQAIRRARRENPGARLVVTGCAAQIEPERFAGMPEVDHVIGNAEKTKAETWSRLSLGGGERVQVDDIMSVRETAAAPDRRLRHPRARLRAGAERLRPPVHLLHHPVRARAVALGSCRRGGGADPAAGRGRLRRRSC